MKEQETFGSYNVLFLDILLGCICLLCPKKKKEQGHDGQWIFRIWSLLLGHGTLESGLGPVRFIRLRECLVPLSFKKLNFGSSLLHNGTKHVQKNLVKGSYSSFWIFALRGKKPQKSFKRP